MGVVEEITPYLTKWYTILIGASVVYFIANYIRYLKFYKAHGCKEPPYAMGRIEAIKVLFNTLKCMHTGTVLSYQNKFFCNGQPLTQQMDIPGMKVLATMDPDNIKALLATQFTDFGLGDRHAHFLPTLGNGIFTLDGEGWKHSRQVLRPQFAREQVAHVKSLEPHIQWFADHIRAKKGMPFDIQELFFRFTIDTATEFLFGDSVHSLWDDEIGKVDTRSIQGKDTFASDFNVVQVYLAARAYSQSLYWLHNSREFKRLTKKVRDFGRHYVDEVLALSEDELDKRSNSGYIFLYELAKKTRDPVALLDQALNILVAGRDTTAGLMSFAMFELARNPKVWEKLRDEVERTFGVGEDADPNDITFESLKQCEYLKQIINETLRMYPSVPTNFRTCLKETTLPNGGGPDGKAPVYVAKGTCVLYSVYFMQRREEFYGKDASEFKPERWEDLKNLGWSYLPFNGGPRICLGQQFALTEASYVLVRLAQLFPKLTCEDARPYPPNMQLHLTLSHFDEVKISMA
ncbi:uncharacterized protein KQ657_000087 [Scheffersomyces spartinae]|uniref:Cytochrome P450 n=1 Tax=Scheffersomyces spartinae TaxID=45513 RepID=A0A9P7VF28_9ASCO|nr:uncharacterized protein KQ657_000087 [Scheffersomyces spartinae]KAG7196076.1 hypothetical protein KQ657_000087 [Scheffersomyces spartinae]